MTSLALIGLGSALLGVGCDGGSGIGSGTSSGITAGNDGPKQSVAEIPASNSDSTSNSALSAREPSGELSSTRSGPVSPSTASLESVAGALEGRARRVDSEKRPSSGGGSSSSVADDELFSAVERMERKVAMAMARVRESVVALEYTAADSPVGARRVATGVVISPQGEVLSIRIDRPPTPAIQGESAGKSAKAAGNPDPAPIIARDAAGRRYRASWIAADPETGLTLLRIPSRTVRPVRIASATPKLGSSVFVVGNPFGLGQSVSRGHVAGLDRALELGPRQLGGLTQVQVPLYPGDSGATVANLRGEWLGLIRGGVAPASNSPSPVAASSGTTAIARSRDDDSNHDRDIGFAIPARDAIWVADQLRSAGRVDRAYLGVRLELNDPNDVGPETEGARLSGILSDSPAAGAGLQAGDRIIGLDRHPIRSASDLTDRLDRIRAQTSVTLSVLRTRQQAQRSQGPVNATSPRSAIAADGDATTTNADTNSDAAERIEVTLRTASRPVPNAAITTNTNALPSPASNPNLGQAPVSASVPAPVVPHNQDALTAVRRADAQALTQKRANDATAASATGRPVISKTSTSNPMSVTVADADGEIDSDAAGLNAKQGQAGVDSASLPVTGPSLRPATVSTITSSSPSVEQAAKRPLPLETQAVSSRPAEIEPISPRAIIDRLDRLERRLDRLERERENAQPGTTPAPSSRPSSEKTRD